MATLIKRIEKDFFLKVVYDEKIPIVYVKNQIEYTLLLEKPTKAEMYFKANRVIPGLQVKDQMDVTFVFWHQVISFQAQVVSIKDVHIVVAAPMLLYTERTAPPSKPGVQEDKKAEQSPPSPGRYIREGSNL
jgi:hypothetical protein